MKNEVDGIWHSENLEISENFDFLKNIYFLENFEFLENLEFFLDFFLIVFYGDCA